MDPCRVLWLLVLLAHQGDCRKKYGRTLDGDGESSTDGWTTERPDPSVISNNPMDIHFYVYHSQSNVESRKELIVDDVKSFSMSQYSKNKSLIILIHGVESSIDEEHISDIKDALLTTNDIFNDCNIVVVDWARLSNVQKSGLRFMAYPIALNHGELVAVKAIRLLRTAFAAGALDSLEEVHLIGDGEGAGVAAYIAKHILKTKDEAVKGKIGRLTGLDPTGPFFTLAADPDLSVKGNTKKNVNFMDVYHTDQGRIGILGPVGHVDFFPNGGGPFQPDCLKNDRPKSSNFLGDFRSSKENLFEEFTNWILGMCAHRKAAEYFKLSIVDRSYLGCKCSTILDSGCIQKCKDDTVFGFFCSPRARGNYQLWIPRDSEPEIYREFRDHDD